MSPRRWSGSPRACSSTLSRPNSETRSFSQTRSSTRSTKAPWPATSGACSSTELGTQRTRLRETNLFRDSPLGTVPTNAGDALVRDHGRYDRAVAGHEHDHSADRRMLAGALALIVGLLVAEIVVGLAASSLALLADAGHMLTDAAALALALVAASVARRPPGGSWTFGFRRVEILAALANGITLVLVGIWIVYAAVRRLIP